MLRIPRLLIAVCALVFALLTGASAAGAAVLPPAEPLREAGVRVAWPLEVARATVEPGTRLVVAVRSLRARSRPVRIALLRVAGAGTRPRVVAAKRLRAGRFAVRLADRGGVRYVLRLTVGGRRYATVVTTAVAPPAEQPPAPAPAPPAVPAPTPPAPPHPMPGKPPACGGEVFATLTLDREIGVPGQEVAYELRNTAAEWNCFWTSQRDWSLGWERRSDDGTWKRVRLAERPADSLPEVLLDAQQSVRGVIRFDPPDFGTYRLVAEAWKYLGPFYTSTPIVSEPIPFLPE